VIGRRAHATRIVQNMSLKKIRAQQAKQFVDTQNQQRRADQAELDSKRMHTDGWVNSLSGVGDAFKDKRLSSYFAREHVDAETAEHMWRSDDMAARIVECLPDEMTREGFEIQIQQEVEGEENDNDGAHTDATFPSNEASQHDRPVIPGKGLPTPGAAPSQSLPEDDDSKRIAELMMAKCEELDVLGKFRQGLQFSRAYGGGAILVGADDGQLDWRKPLNVKAIRSVSYLNVLEPRELVPVYYYGDPRAPKYGEPMIYQLNRIMVAGEIPQDQAYMQIHESRLLRFDGIRVGRRQIVSNAGWGDSIFARTRQVVQDFQQVWQGAALILSDFAQAQLKIKGLAEYVAKNGKDKIVARAQAISAARSITGMVMIDSEEEFSRVTTPISGFPEMLDRFCNRLAAAVKIPVTILMGQAPAGSTPPARPTWSGSATRSARSRSATCSSHSGSSCASCSSRRTAPPPAWSRRTGP
jgi:hypothetical protein